MTSDVYSLIMRLQSEENELRTRLGGDNLNSIRSIRLNKKITQNEIARLLEIDRSTVTKWESGESLPRADKLPELAKILNCTVDDLLKST